MNEPFKFIMKDFMNLPTKKNYFYIDKKENNYSNQINNFDLKTEKEIKEELCPICFGRIKNKCMTNNCLHKFCYECLSIWMKSKSECPLCRTEINEIVKLFPTFKSKKRKYKPKKYNFKIK